MPLCLVILDASLLLVLVLAISGPWGGARDVKIRQSSLPTHTILMLFLLFQRFFNFIPTFFEADHITPMMLSRHDGHSRRRSNTACVHHLGRARRLPLQLISVILQVFKGAFDAEFLVEFGEAIPLILQQLPNLSFIKI